MEKQRTSWMDKFIFGATDTEHVAVMPTEEPVHVHINALDNGGEVIPVHEKVHPEVAPAEPIVEEPKIITSFPDFSAVQVPEVVQAAITHETPELVTEVVSLVTEEEGEQVTALAPEDHEPDIQMEPEAAVVAAEAQPEEPLSLNVVQDIPETILESASNHTQDVETVVSIPEIIPESGEIDEVVHVTLPQEIPVYVPVHVSETSELSHQESIAEEPISIPPHQNYHLRRTGPRDHVHVPIDMQDPDGEVAVLEFTDTTQAERDAQVEVNRVVATEVSKGKIESALANEVRIDEETPEWLPQLSKVVKKLVVRNLEDSEVEATTSSELSNLHSYDEALRIIPDATVEPEAALSSKYTLESGNWPTNMQELINLLGVITHEEWTRHVHGDQNDFALWMEEVLKDPHAQQARNYQDPKAFSTFLRHLR